MDHLDHYRRAVELADTAEEEYAASISQADRPGVERTTLRRAEVLAHLSANRARLAWIAFHWADTNQVPRRTRVPAQENARGAGGQFTPDVAEALLHGLRALDEAHDEHGGEVR